MSKIDNISRAALAGNPRASLTAWLKYEQIVVAAYERHPSPFVYTPTSMTPASVASKLRDAVRGKIAFDYPSSVATENISSWWSEVVVHFDDTRVFITKPGVKKTEIFGVAIGDYAHCFDYIITDELAAIELLLSRGRLKGPIRIEQPPQVLPALLPNVERVMRATTLILL